MTEQHPDVMVFAARWLVEQHLMGVVMLDGDGTVVARHGALVDWVEPGRRCLDCMPFLRAYEDRLEALQRAQAPSLHLPEVCHRDAEGRESSYTVSGAPAPGNAGVALIFQDATRVGELERDNLQQRDDLALAERRLTKANDLAEAAKEAKSVFLANISHELRTPLNVIIGNGEILRDWDPDKLPAEDLRTFAEDILENGTFLLDHINDLLDLAKVEAGGITLVEEPVDLDEIIGDALAVIGRQADARALSLEHRKQPGLPLLIGDARRLRQVMHHLLGNAVKFTPDGGTVSVRSSVDADGCAMIEVFDDGIGIPSEFHDSALQPFGQSATPVENRVQTANGVGLPLAKTLIELHDGTLALHSTPGEGTRITLRFPASRLQVDA